MKGLVIRNGIDIDDNWKDRMVIDLVPFAITPTTFTSALAAGGSLINGTTYFYRVTAIGLNGESVAAAEQSKTAGAVNKTINLDWDAQDYVSEYRIYRGTITGIYDGYFRVFTNSFIDNGSLAMVTVENKIPPVTNSMQGQSLGGAFVGNGQRSFVFFSELTEHHGTYLPKVDDANNLIRQQSYIILMKGNKKLLDINLKDVLYPTTWNTPNDDSGIGIALADIQAWATTP